MTHLIKKQKAIQIVKTLTQNGFVSYFAGGCVRDLVMNVGPKDYDIATVATPDEVAKLFPRHVPVGKQFGVLLVLMDEDQFEVATFRREGGYHDGRHPDSVSFTIPEEDAYRRDFTINGMFYNPIEERVIDFVHGERDIQGGVIRTIGDPEARFGEDKLRLLRAIRFAANLNFRIEEKTWAAIQKLAQTIHLVSQERIRDELVKMLTRSNAGRALDLLDQSGLLEEVLPEITAMKGVAQPPEFHPEGDVFVHTRMLLDQLKDNASPVLALGALLHDVGKPNTFSDDGKRIRFNNHAHVGAEMSKEILKRLRFSNREIDSIVSCVENHMKFANVKEMRIGKLKQFIARDNFSLELELHRIDCLASHGKLELYQFLKNKEKEFAVEDLKPKSFLNGHDLIAVGIKPGPEMKKILEEAYQLQLEGTLDIKEKALEWVKKRACGGNRPNENRGNNATSH